MTSPPHSPPPPARPSRGPGSLPPSTRYGELQTELEAVTEPAQQVALHYELGHLAEFGLGQAAQAVKHYLAAYNLDREFRLALYALLRLFEQRGSHPNLPRLYAAQGKATRTTTERSAALIDSALAARLVQTDSTSARESIDQALAEDPSSLEAALLRGCLWPEEPAQSPGARAALSCRAHHTDDPHRQALALSELAESLAQAGQVDDARAAVLKAVRLSPSLEVTHLAAQTLTRAEGPPEQLVDSLTRHARQLDTWLAELGETLPEGERDALRAEATAVWCQAARLGVGALSTPGDALGCLKEAARLAPDDPWVRQLRMCAHDLLEDRKAAAEEAAALLDLGATGKHAAGLHFRLAELSLTEGALEQARAQLTRAMECSGGSRAAAAMLNDLLFDEGLHEQRLERLSALARHEPETALEAALVAAHDLADSRTASSLFEQAAAHPPLTETALRERYWAALACEDAETTRTAIEALLASELPRAERAALVHHRLELEETAGAAEAEVLATDMEAPGCVPWLPSIVRLRAAERGDWKALALAHLSLAAHDDNPEERAAHLCAAARAQLRDGQAEAAEKSLREALEIDPTQPYPLTLLQEALRESGHEREVVDLLVRTAEQQKSSADAEMSLLLAGAAAEAAGDVARAVEAYREAAERSPASLGPLWALWRLSLHSGDPALRLLTRRALAEREQREAGPGPETLLLAREYEDRGETAMARVELERLLEVPGLAAYAGVELCLSKDASTEAGAAGLAALAHEATESRTAWVRARERWCASSDAAQTADVLAEVLAADPNDRWARWTATTRLARAEAGVDVEALQALVDVTSDPQLLDGLRAETLHLRWTAADAAAPQHGENTQALDLPSEGALSSAAARALLEGTGEGVNPSLRARGWQARLARSSGEDRGAALRGLARAQLRAGDAAAATEQLVARLEEQPEDLASWELLRVAARGAGRPEWVAAACDTLAEQLTGTLWAELSEEAAAVRMDHLGEDGEAEDILRAVLSRHPHRPIAYRRLHDLLTERDDTAALLELVSERIAVIDQADELVQLFYEQARLFRAEGDLEGALGALENLLLLDSEHVAGLALSAEVHTAQQDWEGAVNALRELAQTDIPGGQRKLARLGTADYLEKKLDRPEEALNELLTIETEGLASPAVYVRMANLHEGQGDLDKCVRALQAAVADEARERQPALHARLAKLHVKIEQPAAALAAYGQVLALCPTDLNAARSSARLLDAPGDRDALLRKFEDAVRDELLGDPSDPEPYRKLRISAALRDDRDLELRALVGLQALRAADESEAAWLEGHPPSHRIDAGAALTDAELATLLTPATDPLYRQLAMPLCRAAAEADDLQPSKFGVGRGQKVSPREDHPLRDEVRAMLVALGGELADFYVGGETPTLVRAAPKGLSTHVILGVAVTSPLGPVRRQDVALQVAGARLGCLPLLERSPAEAAHVFHAALLATERPLAASIDASGLSEQSRRLWKAASRRDRKAMEEAARDLDDGGVGARGYVDRTLRHVRRVALLLSGNFEAALAQLLGEAPSAAGVAASEDARDLIRAWLSPELGELRRKLGIAA